jgi:DNA-binding NarL/FixJ family response regulator
VRMAPDAQNLASLRTAAAHVDGPPVLLAVAHAEAVVAGDAAALQSLAIRAIDEGERLLAVEMLEVAATLVDTSRSRTFLNRLEVQLAELRRECEDARSPLSPGLVRPRGLTAREMEIVTLAAAGWTSTAISKELVVSVRTVESHLYRAFAKLGVRHRDELPGALASIGR